MLLDNGNDISGDPPRDSLSLPRDFAIKVVGIDGPHLAESTPDVTVDILLATAPVFTAPDAKAFLKSLKLTAMTADRAELVKAVLSTVLRPLARGIKVLGVDGSVLHSFGGYPPTNPLRDRYFTQVPLRFGAYVAKLNLVPESPNFRTLTGALIDVALSRLDPPGSRCFLGIQGQHLDAASLTLLGSHREPD